MAAKAKKKIFNWYTFKGSYLNFRVALLLFFSSIAIGMTGYMTIENYNFIEAFYMTTITISTVGFSETNPLSSSGRIFTSLFIIYNFGVYTYVLTAFSSYIIHGRLMKNIHNIMIEKEISKLEDHVILCGFGKYGREISNHFLQHRVPFVIIERDPAKIELIQKSAEKILYVADDATRDEVLFRAGIEQARAIISALPNDSDNVFTTLTARQLNSKIKIISRALNANNVKKLKMAGADHVIMPEQIGGFYMATLVNKPGAVEFFSFISNESVSDIHFEEFRYDVLAQKYGNCTLRDLDIRKSSGANVIAVRKANNEFIINPMPDTKLKTGESYIIIGDEGQLAAFRSHYL